MPAGKRFQVWQDTTDPGRAQEVPSYYIYRVKLLIDDGVLVLTQLVSSSVVWQEVAAALRGLAQENGNSWSGVGDFLGKQANGASLL
jgi:hypothetical protein|eukprot:COSAG01_NODE_3401_length_6140_cov_2.306801_3_plen_87_part_00